MPEDKAKYVKKLQDEGKFVAMDCCNECSVAKTGRERFNKGLNAT